MTRLPSSVARRLGLGSRPRRKGERFGVSDRVVTVKRGRRVAGRPMREDDLVSFLVWLLTGCWP